MADVKFPKIVFCLCLFSVFYLVTTQYSQAQDKDLPMPEDKYLSLYQDVATRYNVPLNLLLSISRHESKFCPWAVNIAGKSYFPDSKEEAIALIVANKDKGYDVGLMQINKWWIEKRFRLKLEDVFEPAVNVSLAAWILNENFYSYGNTWKVIGAYHTPPDKNPDRAFNYTKTVTKSFEGYIKAQLAQAK